MDLMIAILPVVTRSSHLSPLHAFRIFACFLFFVSLPFSLINSMESTSCVLSFRMVFFYLVTTGWIFDFM